MAFSEVFRRQAALLIRLLPHVAKEECFALKGGTAINLFVREMPRLSVDIDLTYLPMSSRREALAAIDAVLKRVAQRIGKALGGAQTTSSETKREKATKATVMDPGVLVNAAWTCSSGSKWFKRAKEPIFRYGTKLSLHTPPV